MAIWEYKVITSGKGGFATPALLEKFLNDLGKEEWDILHFQTQPDNPLAFSGVARRTTQRDWTLEDAAAAAARSEADKLRAEFEAKFKGIGSAATSAGGGSSSDDEKPTTLAGEKTAAEDGFRRVRDTERDLDPDAPDEEAKDEWDMLTSEDELPTFFDAIRPHMRRNQRGPGMSVGVEHLAKKWDFSEEDVKGALLECGFAIPEDEDTPPVYIEYEGDLYWLNVNRRGELWLNTKEKPRKVFRTVQGQRVTPEVVAEGEAQPANQGGGEGQQAPNGGNRPERDKSRDRQQQQQPPADDKPAEPLPAGSALLDKIRPMMRRNRRGPGGSGSTSFLSRGLKCSEADLMTAFAALGLNLPASGAKPVEVEIGREIWWLNQDQRGGVWINGQEKREGAPAATEGSAPAGDASAPAKAADLPLSTDPTPASAPAEAAAAAPAPNPGNILAAVRLLLKETKTGAVAGKLERVAEELGKSPDDVTATLVAAGLVVPEKSREKPVFVEHAGEIFWFNRNAKDELWLNAKASKFADADGEKKPARRPRAPKKAE
jgi:hypothetical protein